MQRSRTRGWSAGSVRCGATRTAGRFIRWSWRPPGSAAASARRCSSGWSACPRRRRLTLFLGSDDDYGGTTLYGRDLSPDVLGHAAAAEATPRGHALTFYRRHGYRIVGVLPDVNGPGRPDILMAKRLIG